jgi:hypothetical protein
VTIADLHNTENITLIPTLGEYLPKVISAAGPGANRTYGTYWARMALHRLGSGILTARHNTSRAARQPSRSSLSAS